MTSLTSAPAMGAMRPGAALHVSERAPQRGIGERRGSFSVSEWCRYRGICAATFYNRLRHGEMPAICKIGRRTIITAEADEEWRRRTEQRADTLHAHQGGEK
jgi:GH24 family phage-related lysozyme (muramidase)